MSTLTIKGFFDVDIRYCILVNDRGFIERMTNESD